MTAEPPSIGEPPRPPEGDSPVLDEVWEKFLQDDERAIRDSAPKEPSARARIVTERLRREDAAAGARKGKGEGKGRKRAEPWRAAPNVIPLRRRRKVPNWARNALAALLAAGLAAIALNPSAALSWVRGGSGGSSTAPTAPATAAPTTGAPTPSADAAPFAGSPAEKWADGADGIALPEAKPVGALTRTQVAQALGDIKNYLVATDLDQNTLRGQRPQTAFDLLDPLETKTLDQMNASLKAPAKGRDPLGFISRYNPKELRFIGQVVKTHGLMTFKEGQHGSLEVHTDYTFVYPFSKADGTTQEVVRSIIRRTMDIRVVADASQWNMTPGKLWILSQATNTTNVGCNGVYDGYPHPQFTEDLPSQLPTGPAHDPYDASQPIDISHPDVCGIATRT
ncbi:hypothetical protein [Streptantibioticus ferralitis]|uniref:Uncharacterized protein n=1 Tax=Streptantibioticus ferralitis TaxID=236510 RepID=A0ABT5YYA3_9ACTN|nr:hypothetical protein [Streptantibioticus ferralitis]MDF2256586.1 hypothetical protein [Streptantibioticus ferralitis]